MKKNVSGQKIGAQMVSATDGSAFTSSVTVYVTGDAGTQAVGSVSSGACTHEGNGYHTYAPAQAETNYDLIAFTFIGTGAIPTTVQVETSYPQTGDAYASLGSGVTVTTNNDKTGYALTSAYDAAKTAAQAGDEMDLVNAPNATAVTAIQSGLATASNLATVAGYLDTEIADILADTNELQTDWANGGRLDLLIDAIKAKTDSLTFTKTGEVDANIQSVNDVTVNGDGSGTPMGV